MNENKDGGGLRGFLYKMLIPRFKNGVVKSITCSLAFEMVRAKFHKKIII